MINQADINNFILRFLNPAFKSKEDFYAIILNYYTDKSQNLVPMELLKSLSVEITNYYFEQYSCFRRQYPKSIKRYSSFKTIDLDHPKTHEMVIHFFRVSAKDDYLIYSSILLGLTKENIIAFEKEQIAFYNIF